MSKMKTQPVLVCKRCGRPFLVKDLHTYVPDEDGTLLFELMRGLKDLPCPDCSAKQGWYASQGRIKDWERGAP